jgi:anhydro-N-acetylmuramic acid kinase
MLYRTIGIMSGSSLDGLDLAFVEFQELGGQWSCLIQETACYPYEEIWSEKLRNATTLSARDYELLHSDYGHYIGDRVNEFIRDRNLQFKVGFIVSHGHTTFHSPAQRSTSQLGHGAAIAAETGLPVISDLRAVDVALGGQGAPIVPIGEKLLFREYDLFLNIGGIANISIPDSPNGFVAFDVCPANRVLNMLANETNLQYDDEGKLAASGNLDEDLFNKLNRLDYYQEAYPKSVANEFGTDTIFPILQSTGIPLCDKLRTFTEHVAYQVGRSVAATKLSPGQRSKMLVTGGGAFNKYLLSRLSHRLDESDVDIVVPDPALVSYKEAVIMAFIGVLRWRQEINVMASVTGAKRDSIGGALWS